ncbi:4'-phosphopantetheinyl transferase HetI [Calothrix sp. PCC 7507]|uniref:4'-phosphopantetheinyl transferase HetI n=1 Tax=Calothrix sp. PCC 7507 TaxID=99598 RepID=UPI00029F11E4|nr:4'-phosphopantetheinyl transferase HetI [Calothrix sp. PCC 7507]AFY31468.1 4'-phosphopantetheinyl transferase [Calothrix sp. PCC 7507]
MRNWLPAPTDLTLSPNDVHLWRINLEQTESKLEDFTASLSGDELTRAQRFYFPEHRQRFIAGRGSLRAILGSYLGVAPSEVEFDYEPRGKPVLAEKFAKSGLAFNLSHSQGLGLLGVSDRQIGVDLEYMRSMDDVEALANRFFLPRESELVRSLAPNQKQEIFFRYWTCKEAYLKATGEGIAQLEQAEIYLTPTTPAKLQTSGDWSLYELVPANNYVAAVAVAGCDWDLKCWQY